MSALPRVPRSVLSSPYLALNGGANRLPRTGLAVIGTAATTSSTVAQLKNLVEPVSPAAVFIDGSDGLLGEGEYLCLNELPGRHADLAFRGVLVCIPRADMAASARVRRAIDDLRIPAWWVTSLEDQIDSTTGPSNVVAARPLSTPALRLDGGSTYRAPPAIDLAGLIGRVPHGIDTASVTRLIKGRTVLVTGAGGSIGSQIVHMVGGYGPARIILLERSENALFEIDRQLARRFPTLERRAVLHDVVDYDRTRRVFEREQPEVVFHAAAHKHVPLMEDHPSHAIANNLFGTRSVADAAVACRVRGFVLISSDKAVNPTSVMGATKRLAEVYLRGLAARQRVVAGPGAGTRIGMVRFGNVIGSACSVLTIWSAQLAEGGPLTVTDPRMTRYFMTIPEAASLVIQSAALERADGGSGAPVYVLDMGEPIPILDLAVRFVRAHGMRPRVRESSVLVPEGGSREGEIVDIVFTGVRPGEKLHEELAYAAEMLRPTSHPGIFAWAGESVSDTDADLPDRLVDALAALSTDPETPRPAIFEAIRRFVPEMVVRPGV